MIQTSVTSSTMYYNITWSRSTDTTPFKLLFGVCPRLRDDPEITELLLQEISHNFDEERNNLREKAHRNIRKIQQENRRSYDNKRKNPAKYKEGDLVAIKRTKRGPGFKFAP